MEQRERQVIDELFGKLRQVEQQSPQRDREAEAYIRQQVSTLPVAPYYMAQAILVQEQALANAQVRIQQLERQLAERPAGGGGGFLSGLFGGGQTAPVPQRPAPQPGYGQPGYGQHPAMHAGAAPGYGTPAYGAPGHGSPWGGRAGGFGGGGGFLAGAMQTALGVAGGMLVADAISSAFEGGAADAADQLASYGQDAAGQVADYGQDAAQDLTGAEPAAYDDLGAEGEDFGSEEI